MKVLLINPPYKLQPPFNLFELPDPPLNLMSIAGTSIQRGHDIKILDMPVLELGFNEITKSVEIFLPDVIGISTHAAPYVPIVRKTINYAKIAKKDVIIVTGGHIPTFMKNDIFSIIPGIDFAVIGEGELTFPDILDVLENGRRAEKVKGIAYKNKNKTIITPEQKLVNLNKLPPQPHHLLPLKDYVKHNFPYAIESQRGCPFKCSYCGTNLPGWRGNVRQRDVSIVINEIKEVVKIYGFKKIGFTDDTFTFDKNKVLHFCEEIKKNELHKRINWHVLTRVDLVDHELLHCMKEAGCSGIGYGIESASQRVLDNNRKQITLKRSVETIKLTQKLGINANLFLIVGTPSETNDSLADTYKFLDSCGKIKIQTFIFKPLPGSMLGEDFKKKFLNLVEENEEKHLGSDDEWSAMNILKKPIPGINSKLTCEEIIKTIIKLNYSLPSRYSEDKHKELIKRIINKKIPIINPEVVHMSISINEGGLCYVPKLDEDENFEDIYRNVFKLDPIHYEVFLRCIAGNTVKEIIYFISSLFEKENDEAKKCVVEILKLFYEKRIISGIDMEKEGNIVELNN